MEYWKEFNNAGWRSFALNGEPECIHILKHRDDEYIVVYNDAYDLSTGRSEVVSAEDIFIKFNIKIEEHVGS
jgi:hypothetical protein